MVENRQENTPMIICDIIVIDGKSINSFFNSRSDNRVCSVAWISQRPPEPLTWVQIPADPLSSLGEI